MDKDGARGWRREFPDQPLGVSTRLFLNRMAIKPDANAFRLIGQTINPSAGGRLPPVFAEWYGNGTERPPPRRHRPNVWRCGFSETLLWPVSRPSHPSDRRSPRSTQDNVGSMQLFLHSAQISFDLKSVTWNTKCARLGHLRNPIRSVCEVVTVFHPRAQEPGELWKFVTAPDDLGANSQCSICSWNQSRYSPLAAVRIQAVTLTTKKAANLATFSSAS